MDGGALAAGTLHIPAFKEVVPPDPSTNPFPVSIEDWSLEMAAEDDFEFAPLGALVPYQTSTGTCGSAAIEDGALALDLLGSCPKVVAAFLGSLASGIDASATYRFAIPDRCDRYGVSASAQGDLAELALVRDGDGSLAVWLSSEAEAGDGPALPILERTTLSASPATDGALAAAQALELRLLLEDDGFGALVPHGQYRLCDTSPCPAQAGVRGPRTGDLPDPRSAGNALRHAALGTRRAERRRPARERRSGRRESLRRRTRDGAAGECSRCAGRPRSAPTPPLVRAAGAVPGRWGSMRGVPGRRVLVASIAFALAAFLLRLCVEPPDHGYTRYATIAFEMVRSGDWVAPSLDEHLYVDKPPFAIWLIAVPMALANAPASLAQHAPNLVALLLSVLFLQRLGARLFGRRDAGWLAAGLYLSALLPFALLRDKRIDPLFAALLLAALDFLHAALALHAPSRRRLAHWLAAAVFLAAATLTKGPLAVVFFAAIALLYAAWNRRLADLATREVLAAVALFLALAAIWPLAMLGDVGVARVGDTLR